MGRVKDFLMDVAKEAYPDDIHAQDELQHQVRDGCLTKDAIRRLIQFPNGRICLSWLKKKQT